MNNNGPSTESCGIPQFIVLVSDFNHIKWSILMKRGPIVKKKRDRTKYMASPVYY